MTERTAANPDRSDEKSGLLWLIRLRWLTLAALILLCLYVRFGLMIALPGGVLTGCLAALAISNWLAARLPARWQTRSVSAVLIFADIANVTIMFFFAGGMHNPFTSLYVLLVALAALLLPVGMAIISLIAAGAGFFLLFWSPHELVSIIDGSTCCNDHALHLRGMWLSMILSAAAILYFINRLNRTLADQRKVISEARDLVGSEDRYRALAAQSAALAHELGTPLGTIAVIAGDLESSCAGTCNPTACADDAKLIQREVARCKEAIDRISRDSESRADEVPGPLELDHLPTLITAGLPENLAACVRWNLESSSGSWMVPRGGLCRAVSILIRNALDASPPESAIEVRLADDSRNYTVTVIDHGCGIPKESLERITEPFFTTKQPGLGMGLGLFLVKVFCESTGSELEFDSTAGVGTTATLRIPKPIRDSS